MVRDIIQGLVAAAFMVTTYFIGLDRGYDQGIIDAPNAAVESRESEDNHQDCPSKFWTYLGDPEERNVENPTVRRVRVEYLNPSTGEEIHCSYRSDEKDEAIQGTGVLDASGR